MLFLISEKFFKQVLTLEGKGEAALKEQVTLTEPSQYAYSTQ